MEKEWPPVKESAVYRCGLLAQFLEKRSWEDNEEYLDKMITATYSDDEDCQFTYQPRLLKMFLDQLRNTRGYGVTIGLPMYFGTPFLVYPDDDDHFKPMYDARDEAMQIAINHITSKTNKPYKFEKWVNFNYTGSRTFFLTFTAKDTSLPDAAEETFLAAVYAPLHLGSKCFVLKECLLKPDHDAPTTDPTTIATAADAPTTTEAFCADDQRKKQKISRVDISKFRVGWREEKIETPAYTLV